MKFCLCFLLLFSIFSAFPDEAAEYTGVIRNAAVSDSAQKGRIELYVFVNEEKVYPRTTVKGTRNFRIGDTFRFLYRSGDQVRVILCRKSFCPGRIIQQDHENQNCGSGARPRSA